MRIILIICSIILFVSIISFSNPNSLNRVEADQWFDSYGDIPWIEERVHLDNFAFHLQQSPETLGYIAFRVGEKDKLEDVKFRINRAKKYLICESKIQENRIIVVDAGKDEETEIILQPALRNNPRPKF